MKKYQLQYLSVDSGEWETFDWMFDFDRAIDRFTKAVKSDSTIPHRIIMSIEVEMMSYQDPQEAI